MRSTVLEKNVQKIAAVWTNTDMSFFLLLPTHLFPIEYLEKHRQKTLVLIEAYDLFTRYKYHKKRLVFLIESMRRYRDLLKNSGFSLKYISLDPHQTLLSSLGSIVKKGEPVDSFQIEERFLQEILQEFFTQKSIQYTSHESPLFLHTEEEFSAFFAKKKRVQMRIFYEKARVKLNLLMDEGRPCGGKWSFDADNRKPLPKKQPVFPRAFPKPSAYHAEVQKCVSEHFPDHPGDVEGCFLPTSRKEAMQWLDQFFVGYFSLFGPYEDAISTRDPFLFHSALSPLLNIGLLTPKEVVEKAITIEGVSLNSLEGFIRQIIGWREFIRGVDAHHGSFQEKSNFFSHKRKMQSSWYEGSTGIVPLDDAIKKSLRYGYCHHIERLMLLSNLMLLAEIDPKEVFHWLLSYFVDSHDWVMAPNVYGMGQFSDGGIFATKPYFCGSNYLLKMSDYKKDSWCDVVDGLYWRFVEKKRDFLGKHPRLLMMVRLLDKMDPSRKQQIFSKAERFLKEHTS